MFSRWILIKQKSYFGFLCHVVVKFYYTSAIFRVTENLGCLWLGTIISPRPTFRVCDCRKTFKPLLTVTFPSSLSLRHPIWNNSATLKTEAERPPRPSEHWTSTRYRRSKEQKFTTKTRNIYTMQTLKRTKVHNQNWKHLHGADAQKNKSSQPKLTHFQANKMNHDAEGIRSNADKRHRACLSLS